MIISCPACATRYVVPDKAIGAEGRTVRCAQCRTSWFQNASDTLLEEQSRPAAPASPASKPAPPPAPPAPPVRRATEADGADSNLPSPTPTPAPGPSIGVQRPGPAPKAASTPPAPVRDDNRADDEAAATKPNRPPVAESPPPVPPAPSAPPVREFIYDSHDDRSQFDSEPPFRPRRNPLKIATWVAAIFAITAVGLIAAANFWGLPDWIPVERPTFARAGPDLVLEFPREEQDRRKLPNGTQYFGVSGSVTNVGSTTRRVPEILIVLRDDRERIVYRQVISTSQRTLAPGESVSINQAVTDVPRAAKTAEFGWSPA